MQNKSPLIKTLIIKIKIIKQQKENDTLTLEPRCLHCSTTTLLTLTQTLDSRFLKSELRVLYDFFLFLIFELSTMERNLSGLDLTSSVGATASLNDLTFSVFEAR